MSRQLSVKGFFSVSNNVFLLFMMFLILSFFVIPVSCQVETSFTTADVYEIPSNNSSIQFSANGTFDNAFTENNTWFFDGLHFGFDFLGAQKLNISVSGTDCNVTINPFFSFTRASQGDNVTRVFFSYMIEGQGTQTINLGFDLQQGQIEAILDGEWIGLNHGWTRSSDGTVTVTAPVSNVTVSYYGHPESYLDEPNLFEDHYVVIASSFSLAVIVGLATIICLKKGTGEK